MKEFNLADHPKEICHIFEVSMNAGHVLILWQPKTENTDRVIYRGQICEVDSARQIFSLNSLGNREFVLGSGNIFFYNHSKNYIFKSEQISIQSNLIELKFPEMLKVLDKADCDNLSESLNVDFDEVSQYNYDDNKLNRVKNRRESETEKIDDIMRVRSLANEKKTPEHQRLTENDNVLFEQELSYLSLDEEDAKFASQRTAPRAKPAEGKVVNICGVSNSDNFGVFSLYDLSRGGISFMSYQRDEFELKSYIKVLGFDLKRFEKPMLAQIMNIRPVDEQQLEFKVGCRFLTEDEVKKFQ